MRLNAEVLTLATPAAKAVARLSRPNWQAYAARRGYGFVALDDTPDSSRHPYWGKIRLLLDRLGGADWLFWADADALVTNPHVRLEDLGDGFADLIVAREAPDNPFNPGGINTGLMLVRNSPAARRLLETTYAQTQFLPHRFPEQAALNYVVDAGLTDAKVKTVPKRTLNAELHDYQPGDFVLHFLGLSGRVFLMRKQLGVWPPKAPREVHLTRPAPELAQADRLRQAGRTSHAAALCESLLRRDPSDARATHMLGLLHLSAKRFDDAFDFLCRSVELDPTVADFHANLGAALMQARLASDAVDCYRSALRFNPRHAVAQLGLGRALHVARHYDDAAKAFETAARLRPRDPQPHALAARSFQRLGRSDLASGAARAGLAVAPDDFDCLHAFATAARTAGDLETAIASYERALALQPSSRQVHSELLFAFLHSDHFTAAEVAERHREWGTQHAGGTATDAIPPSGVHLARSADRHIRVGYVSSSFLRHPVTTLCEPILAGHDRDRFDVYCYSNAARPDSATARLQSYGGTWRHTARLNDRQLAERIREDGIDILVDLDGHNGKNRLLTYAMRPAPVQATYLDYPATTGVPAMDFRITDAFHDPPGLTEHLHTETLIRLPHAWCYRPTNDEDVSVSALPARQNGYVTFGCLNRPLKVTDRMARLWAEILRRVPGSRWVALSEPHCENATLGRLTAAGIDAMRVQILPRSSRMDYLRAHREIDIALDTFPYNGLTTTLDALWMGVPTVSLTGDSFVSRAGLSILTAIGLSELAVTTDAGYVGRAVELASRTDELSALRNDLRCRLDRSPLRDEASFIRELESAYVRTLELRSSPKAD